MEKYLQCVANLLFNSFRNFLNVFSTVGKQKNHIFENFQQVLVPVRNFSIFFTIKYGLKNFKHCIQLQFGEFEKKKDNCASVSRESQTQNNQI